MVSPPKLLHGSKEDWEGGRQGPPEQGLGCGRREGEAEGLGSPENTVAKFEPSLEVTVGGGCWASEICSSPPPRGIQSRTLQGPVPTVPHLPR